MRVWESLSRAVLRAELGLEMNPGAIDDDLPRVLEIDGDPAVDHRLHLSEAPVRAVGVAHKHPRLEEIVHRRLRLREGRMSAPDLTALVSARLCHDLISPM